jgi:hypothetical protein
MADRCETVNVNASADWLGMDRDGIPARLLTPLNVGVSQLDSTS